MIQFTNPGTLNPLSITTFGVSVKEGKNPIGFFGTGLKYAIAVLLRNKQRVSILTGNSSYLFALRDEVIRGVVFQIVCISSPDGCGPYTPMGFTTELGKQWDLWMAYREIACNCTDEGGKIERISSGNHALSSEMPSNSTRIIVSGEEFEAVYEGRRAFLLESEPTIKQEKVDIHFGASTGIFYRGVRVGELEKPTLFTYNLKSKQILTEDRTLRSSWELPYTLGAVTQTLENTSMLRTILLAPQTHYESTFQFTGHKSSCSAEFLTVMAELTTSRLNDVNSNALIAYREITKLPFAPKPFELSRVQDAMLSRSITFCKGLGYDVEAEGYSIQCIESLGTGVLGMAIPGTGGNDKGTILIASSSFTTGGTKSVTLTLLEEFIHLKTGHADCTRGLQQYLFDKIVGMGEELSGEPL